MNKVRVDPFYYIGNKKERGINVCCYICHDAGRRAGKVVMEVYKKKNDGFSNRARKAIDRGKKLHLDGDEHQQNILMERLAG